MTKGEGATLVRLKMDMEFCTGTHTYAHVHTYTNGEALVVSKLALILTN